MLVSEVAGRALHQQGVEVVFGLMGSGNLAITNALVAAETMVGINGRIMQALPRHRLREVLAKYGRLVA